MKTNKSLAIAMIALSIFASNAFAVLRSPYPSKPSPPDRIITIIIGQVGMTGWGQRIANRNEHRSYLSSNGVHGGD